MQRHTYSRLAAKNSCDAYRQLIGGLCERLLSLIAAMCLKLRSLVEK